MTEHKVFVGTFEAKDDSQGTFSARFATLNVVDHQQDVTLPGAFGKQSVLVEAYGHNDKVLPVGMGEISEQGNEAMADGRFFLDTDGGREHYRTLKNLGPAGQWSYTFEVQDSAPGVFDGQDVRFLKKMHVIAVAPVQRGAGINTQSVSIKAADKAVTRTEADGDHPAGHYLVVEDPETVTTWHLRVRAVNGDPDHRLMGAAWAALHGGFRGNRYEGPGKTEAIAKLTRMYAAEEMDVPKADWSGETKSGRVLAQRNADRILAAYNTLTEVLKDAGLLETAASDSADDGDDTDQGKGRKITPRSSESSTLAARVAMDLMENE
ncbi:MAG: hypothetical protein MUO38_07480 [Anaerolineales bacterium]|nr:hypothetical protein [Anaerolineales bacterium]